MSVRLAPTSREFGWWEPASLELGSGKLEGELQRSRVSRIEPGRPLGRLWPQGGTVERAWSDGGVVFVLDGFDVALLDCVFGMNDVVEVY